LSRITSTNWSDGSKQSTNWAGDSVNSSNWEDDDPADGDLLLENSDNILTEDSFKLLLQ